MSWKFSASADEFAAAAGAFLGADPVRNTVLLTVLETLRQSGASAYADVAPVFGWHEGHPGAVDGAFLHTPPYPVLFAPLPQGSARSFLELLGTAGRRPTAVNVVAADETGFAAAWASATGGASAARQRSRLFRLGTLIPARPTPPGAARLATTADWALLVAWHAAFAAEATATVTNPERTVREQLSHDGIMLWEAVGHPVSMAGLSRSVAGVTRVVGVYTPPQHRRRGYAGGITAAVSQRALASGADDVVLYTDVANPTSNALYLRLGYRPVEDRVHLGLTAGPVESS